MNLSQLYYFQKLAQIQHYSTAAKQLSISQPALSSSISSLESELHVALFQKCGRNVRLTDYGKEFYGYVSRCLKYIEQGSAVMKEYSNQISGSISIGCIPTLLDDFLPNIIHNYQSRFEKASFEVYHDMSNAVIDGILSRKYDIGFCSKVENIPELVFVPVNYQEIIVICNKVDSMYPGDSIPLAYLKNQDNIITYRDSIPIGKTVKSILTKNNIHADYHYDDELSIGGIVTKFNYIGVCADTGFLSQFDNIRKIHIVDLPLDTRIIYMCYRKDTMYPAIVESFMNHVITHESNLPE